MDYCTVVGVLVLFANLFLRWQRFKLKAILGANRMNLANAIQRINQTFLLIILTLFIQTASAEKEQVVVQTLQKQMLFRSFIQDSNDCKLYYDGGNEPIFDAAVASSAASSCPDAFAWVQLAKSIKNEWWDWGLDQTVWPTKPWPLCSNGNTKKCCDPNKQTKEQPEHCPAFRADYANPSSLPACLLYTSDAADE